MFCPNCGLDLNDNTRICPRCKTQINIGSNGNDSQSGWTQDNIDGNSWGNERIADGGLYGDSGFDTDSGFPGDFRGDDSSDGFDVDVHTGNSTFGGSYSSGGTGNKPPILKLFGFIAGGVCLLAAIVSLVVFVILPRIQEKSDSGVPTDSSVDQSNEQQYAEENESSTAEEIGPTTAAKSHEKDFSNVSVSVTTIQPPVLVEGTMGKSAVNKVSADSEAGSNSAQLIIDDDINTFWASDANLENPSITLDFGSEKDASIIEVRLGAWSSESDFENYGVPTSIDLEIDGYVYPLSFSDSMTVQYIVFSEKVEVSQMMFKINDTNGNGSAISEITVYY